jgi:hypothetical protein
MKDTLQQIIPEEAPSPTFESYAKLFELESNMAERMSLNEVDHRAVTIGLIFRNASFHPENQVLISTHPGVLELLNATLNIPLPRKVSAEFDAGLSFTSTYHSLEHRKNAIITLSNISHTLVLKTQMTRLLLLVCEDFLDTPYEYPILDLLSKLLLKEANQRVICNDGVDSLTEKLLRLLPTVWPSEPTHDELSSWELILVILLSLTSFSPPKESKKLFQLCRKPLGPHGPQFDTQREKCINILKQMRVGEFDLIVLMRSSMALGDHWMALLCSHILVDISNK